MNPGLIVMNCTFEVAGSALVFCQCAVRCIRCVYVDDKERYFVTNLPVAWDCVLSPAKGLSHVTFSGGAHHLTSLAASLHVKPNELVAILHVNIVFTQLSLVDPDLRVSHNESDF